LPESIGERIRRLRLAAGLSQRELARLAGVSQSLIAKIEGGKVNPRVETLERIMRALQDALSRSEKVEMYMSSPVITVRDTEPVRKAIEIMDKYGFSQLPVVDSEGRVIGTVLESSVLRALRSRGMRVLEEPVSTIMEAPLPQVDSSESLSRVIQLLENSPAVLVVREGRLVGIVTKIDILRRWAHAGGLQWNLRGV